MGLLGIAVTAFLVGLSGAVAPGPLMIVTLERAARFGSGAGMRVCLGHGLVEAVLVIFLSLGLGTILAQPRLVGMVSAAGAIVLLWMGGSLVRDAYRTDLVLNTTVKSGGSNLSLGMVGAGMAATLGNPYWLVWWATVGASYVVMASQFQAPGLAVFFGGHFSADVLVLGLVSLLAARGSRLIATGWYRALLTVLGLFLLGMAVYFGYSAWQFWYG
ncbi:MAG: LysE family transporter [Syntrophomonadaceae bacterium]|jgi:threonine/homoserine/homoserine lactone efflux protein|nr:LysE family transporter [Syntrophomonadaceae bacterium]